MTNDELAALSQPGHGPLLKEVAALTAERRAQLVDRLRDTELAARGTRENRQRHDSGDGDSDGDGDGDGDGEREMTVLVGGKGALTDILRAGGVSDDGPAVQADLETASETDEAASETASKAGKCGAEGEAQGEWSEAVDRERQEDAKTTRGKDEL